MKPQIEKRAKSAMRFFTPELYMRYNSHREEEADGADAAWEAAVDAYRRHLAKMAGLPRAVRNLSQMNLHDAEILAGLRQTEAGARDSRPGAAVLTVRHDGQILSLIYLLDEPVREFAASKRWPFSKRGKHWLYDEVDISTRGGPYVHRVLFSDGASVAIPFHNIIVQSFAVPAPNNGNGTLARALPTNRQGAV